MPLRYDSGTLGRVTRTPQGGISVPALLTRTGVFTYRDQQGQVTKELRPADEVFHPDSLASMNHATVTDLHPGEKVGPHNFKNVSVGHVSTDAHPEAEYVAATLLIQDADAIAKVDRSERRELSCGYDCKFDETPGVYQGEQYDRIQRQIRYNHVALLPVGTGRAGKNVALRLDSLAAIQIGMTVRIDGVDYVIGSAEHVAKLNSMNEKTQGELAVAKARADSADVALATAKKDAATAGDPKIFNARVKARSDLLVLAHRVAAKKGTKFDDAAAAEADDGSILTQLCKQIAPDMDLTGKSPDYVAGAAMALIMGLLKDESTETATDGAKPPPPPAPPHPPGAPLTPDSLFAIRAGSPAPKTDALDVGSFEHADAEAARTQNKKDMQGAWQKPLHMTQKSGSN